MTEAWLVELSPEDCLSLLKAHVVGRIGLIKDDAPVVLPVNYKVIKSQTLTGPWIALRTRSGNVIDQIGTKVCFQIDGVDEVHRQGWSVLVRGTLHGLTINTKGLEDAFTSDPWLSIERDSWLVIEPSEVTGRALRTRSREWPFVAAAYL
jgi:Pyridoxamine 5'-phosphate oxidase